MELNDTRSNDSQQPLPAYPLVVFGFIQLPQKYEVERDVCMSLVALMSIVSIISNTLLLLVILRDPFKKLRTITAILLAFTALANLCNALVLFLDNLFFWSNKMFPSELIVYLGAVTSSFYFIGNVLHTVNIYGAIVNPVHYAVLAPKVRKILIQFLSAAWICILLVIIIPPYTLPKSKVPLYVKGVLTMILVLLAVLAFIFGYLYMRIFQSLHARKQKLTLSFHLKRTTVRGRRINKKNDEIIKTLFIHVVFFMITTVPGSVIFLIFLYCDSCNQVTIQLAGLFAFPMCYASLLFHPFLWLSRLHNYRKAMKETLCFWRKKSHSSCSLNSESILELEQKTRLRNANDFL